MLELLPLRGTRNQVIKVNVPKVLPLRGSRNHKFKVKVQELLPLRGSRNHKIKLELSFVTDANSLSQPKVLRGIIGGDTARVWWR